jgi:aspartate kinase
LEVAGRIARSQAQGHSLVIVVSAMGQSTDELIELANEVSKDPPHREMDMLLSTGERISMALLSMALADLGVQAVSLTGSQTGILTTSSHRRARIERILGDRARAALAQNKVVIVAGFQGMSAVEKEITTLGRGGSDTTAVALAAALGAERCEIYTDVDGVFTADPRVVPAARHLERVPSDQMVELATRGAGVLHPRSVELARRFDVPLWVLNSLKPDSKGTQIMNQGMEDYAVAGITAAREKLLITVQLARPTVLGAVWDHAAQLRLSIVAPMFSQGEVRFFADRDAEGDWRKLFEKLSVEGFVKTYAILPEWVPVSVVGSRFSQDSSAIYQVIETLARHHISVTIGSGSALAVTVAVPETHADDAVRALHDEFFKEGGNPA